MLYPTLEKGLSYVIPHKIATYIAVSLSAQLGILPFIASFSQNLNFPFSVCKPYCRSNVWYRLSTFVPRHDSCDNHAIYLTNACHF